MINFYPPDALKTLSVEEVTLQIRWRKTMLHFVTDPEVSKEFLSKRRVKPDSGDLKIFCAWQRRWLEKAILVAIDKGIEVDKLELMSMEEWEELNGSKEKPKQLEDVFLESHPPERRPALLRDLVNILMGEYEKAWPAERDTKVRVPLEVDALGTRYHFRSAEELKSLIDGTSLPRLKKLEETT